MIARLLQVFPAALIGLALLPAGADDDRWLIVPGERVGPITATTSEQELMQVFGSRNIRRHAVEIGEGIREDGTVVYFDDAVKRLEILWKDPATRLAPKRIQITGARSQWHLADGITLGTTLRQLEAANGGPFMIVGFGWDYGGTIVSWEDGLLSRSLRTDGSVFLRLTPDYNDPADARLEQEVLGDRDFPSSHPALQQIDPTVEQIVVGF